MKNFKCIFPIILFLIYINSLAQNTIPIPFLQPYDSYRYGNQPVYNTLETYAPFYINGPENLCPQKQQILDAENYSWAITPRANPIKGNALKLTVHPGDHPCKAHPPRTRAETLFKLPNENNTDTYIRWDVFIPDNHEFTDTIPSGGGPLGSGDAAYHKIFQMASRFGDFTYPLVGLDYYFDDIDMSSNVRDLRFLIISSNDVNTRIRLHINNAIRKGEWNEITYRSYMSNNENLGEVQIWINGNPVILDPVANPNPSQGVHQCIVGNDPTVAPFKANIATKALSDGNNFKFGHYRRHFNNTSHSIYIDNVKVTHNFPPTEIPIQLLSQYCDQQIDISDQNIECEQVTGATNYKFRFGKDGDYRDYNWVDSASPRINLLDYAFLQPGETYNVQVRAQGNGFDFNYGEICTITTAKHTKLRSVDCDNLNSQEFNGQIGALKVHNATNYKFRFQRFGEPTRYFDSPNTFMTPSSVSGLSYYKEYIVDVRASGIGFDFNYGETCTIKFDNQFITRSQSNTRIYPNPTSDQLNIKSEQQIQSIRVVDVFGNLKKVDVLNNFSGVNTQKLSKGLYFIQINYGDYQEHLSFVKD